MVNFKLAEERNISERNQRYISALHTARECIFRDSQHTTDKQAQKKLYKSWVAIENLLQELWEFDVDDSYIKFWEFPACTCQVIDNAENYPSGPYYYISDCPVHGMHNERD